MYNVLDSNNEHNRIGKYEVGDWKEGRVFGLGVLVRPAPASPPTPGSAPGGSAPHFAAGPAAESAAASAPAGGAAVAAIPAVGIAIPCNHKVRINKEYQSACSLVGIGTLPTSSSPASAPLPTEQGGGALSTDGGGMGGVPFPTTGEKA
jgi:hypothetical protein